jgi:RimJ/RimL family protein N-acetyltransferase
MSEALAALEKEVFGQGINRIYIGNDTRNIRSVNVAKRAGYHLDGVLRQNRWDDYSQSFVDSNVWSKLKEEYK